MQATPSRSPDWQQIENLFNEAAQMEPAKRPAFLERACGSNTELRAEVESLLRSLDQADAFLDSAVQGAATAYLAQQSTSPIEPGVCFGSYRVIQVLGAGGMGEVYLAEDTRLKRKVALKRMAPAITWNPMALRRFQLEAQTLSALNQANLLTVFDFCQADGKNFLVTEYVEGETLRQILNRGPVTQAKALDVAIQVTTALTEAHKAGIVHRDIKPENIMVRSDGCVKVLDFGIAKLTEITPAAGVEATTVSAALSSLSGVLLGTPRYMSPEQARGMPVDARSDLFSLGAVVYEMLTGKPAFSGATQSDIVADILRSQPARLPGSSGGTSRKLAKIVNKLLVKDRDQRYQRADELLGDLQQFRSDEEFSKHRSRKKLWWVLATLVILEAGAALIAIRSKTPPAASGTPRSLAVLPFHNLRPSPDTDFLGYSLADEVIAKLAYVKALTVRPASSIRRYRDSGDDLRKIAGDLNADMLLTGTYLKDGDDLQITARLIGFKPQAVLWQNTLNVQYGKLLTVHERVAQLIIRGLELRLGPDEAVRLRPAAKVDPLAYEYYLRGVDLYAASNFQGAIEMLEKSAAIEPNYAPTWAHLGRAYTTHASLQFGGREDYRRAETAYQKAIAADPFSPEPRVYMANLFTDTGRVEEAVPLLRVALQSSPNDAEAHWELGYAYRFGGMLPESAAECELARRLDPEVKINTSTLNSYLYLGEYDKFLKSLPSNDSALLVFYHGLGSYYQHLQAEAISDFERAYELAPDLIQAQIGKAITEGLNHRSQEGISRLQETEQKMRERGVTDPEANYKIAQAYALLGDREDGLEVLRRSVTGGFFPYTYIGHDPLLTSLHNSPSFSEILERTREREGEFRQRFASTGSKKQVALQPMAGAQP